MASKNDYLHSNTFAKFFPESIPRMLMHTVDIPKRIMPLQVVLGTWYLLQLMAPAKTVRNSHAICHCFCFAQLPTTLFTQSWPVTPWGLNSSTRKTPLLFFFANCVGGSQSSCMHALHNAFLRWYYLCAFTCHRNRESQLWKRVKAVPRGVCCCF